MGLITPTRCNSPEYTPGRIIAGVKAAYRLDYTRVYYRPIYARGILWPRPIRTLSGQIIPHDSNHNVNSVERYTQVTEDSVLSVKLREKAMLTELKS